MTLSIEVKFRILTKQDRCDRCGAQAQLQVKTPTGELLFCGHHAALNELKFNKLGYPRKYNEVTI